MSHEPTDLTETLVAHTRGDADAAARLFPLVYDELRKLAAGYMRRERKEHTLQPTALVHEAYLRLVDISRIDWQGKTHFYAMAAIQMRRVLVEHARKVGSKKRGAEFERVTLDENVAEGLGPSVDLLALDEALEKLALKNKRRSKVVILRFFAGLDTKGIAHALNVSTRTVSDDWRMARAWLARELSPNRGEPE